MAMHSTSWPLRLALVTVTLSVAACGGGGSDVAAPPPAAANLVLTGTAARGAALAGAAIEAKCASGTGSATSGGDGSFTITIAAGALPCALRATSGAEVLHSVASGTGQSARANITPVTELVVARLAAASPATYYSAFTGAAGPTDAAAQAALTAVVEMLKPAGTDFGNGANALSGALVAGDAQDQKLDALQVRLTANALSLAEFAAAVARTSPGADPSTFSTTASLPPELLLASQAANCASLRSGRYRVLVNIDGGTSPAATVLTLDATTLTLVDDAGGTEMLTANGTCDFLNASGGDIFVNKAGIGMGRVRDTGGTFHALVFFPEQAHAVAELAGEHNTMAFEPSSTGGGNRLTSSTFSLDTSGKLTALLSCPDLVTCVASTPATLPGVTYSADSEGGFDVANTGAGDSERAFAYRSGSGELMLVKLASAGDISFATRNAAQTLPPVGRTQQLRNLFVDSIYTASAPISISRNTIVSVDAASGTYARNAVQNLATGATRPETLGINSLRNGYVRRSPATGVVHSDGVTSNVAEFISLLMRGMEFQSFALPSSNQMGLAALESSAP